MAVINVNVPTDIAEKFEPYSVVEYKTFLSEAQGNLPSFHFDVEDINQEEFLQALKDKNG